MSPREKSRQPRQNKKNRPHMDKPLECLMSVADITLPSQPIDGQTPEERLEAVCLEVCQIYPFKTGLVNASTPAELKQMLRLADDAGIGVEGLVGVIRKSHGVQKDVMEALHKLKPAGGLKNK